MIYQAVWASGVAIRFRMPTWAEFRKAHASSAQPAIRNLWVYRACVVEGPPPHLVPAGVVAWLGIELIDKNAFTGQFQLVNRHLQLSRQWLGNSFLEHARALVAGTFRYTFEEIDTWDAETFFKRFAQAEVLVGKRIDTQDPNLSEEERQKQHDQARSNAKREAWLQKKREVDQRRAKWSK